MQIFASLNEIYEPFYHYIVYLFARTFCEQSVYCYFGLFACNSAAEVSFDEWIQVTIHNGIGIASLDVGAVILNQ